MPARHHRAQLCQQGRGAAYSPRASQVHGFDLLWHGRADADADGQNRRADDFLIRTMRGLSFPDQPASLSPEKTKLVRETSMEFKEIATGLKFPEGPVAMDDGSVIIVEIPIGRITRVTLDGKLHTVATPGGGPNGLAVGPDGHLY